MTTVFDRIAGYRKEKEQLMGLREMLLHLDDYRQTGIRMPRGVLLYGEPGVGKTVMAQSVAGDPLHCVELRSADCTRETAADHVTNAFKAARAQAPCVLLIDELDKIAEGSERFYIEGNDRVMKILLQELDGREDNSGVLVIATCNQLGHMNPALLRAGRFDRLIHVGVPSRKDRREIIRHYLSNIRMDTRLDEEYLADITNGYTGARLECLINESAIIAKETAADVIGPEQIRTAMNRIAFGALEGDAGDLKKRRAVAVHEAGHALIASLLLPDELLGATVIPQGGSDGHVHLCSREENEMTAEDVEKRVAVALAGAAAEQMVYRTVFLSSESDMSKAFSIVQSLITETGVYGLSLLFPDVSLARPSAAMMNRIDDKRTEVLERMNGTAARLLREHRAAFDAIVDALVERYTLSSEEIRAIVDEADADRTTA